jgi:hypothetical protein
MARGWGGGLRLMWEVKLMMIKTENNKSLQTDKRRGIAE